MSTNTSIEWTQATWNPVRGCCRVSEGCRNCYAERQAVRFSGGGKPLISNGPFYGFVTRVNGHPSWTGKVQLVEDRLEDPIHWRTPRMIFVNSMSDLWHESLPRVDIARVYAVMAYCQWHTFQVLTKRPEVRYRYCGLEQDVRDLLQSLLAKYGPPLHPKPFRWPLPNVWEGVSVEDFPTWDVRVHFLRATPAVVRFVSYEPALADLGCPLDLNGIDWLIVGGESGPGARPFDVSWARNTILQCKAAGVACFVKQLGADPREQDVPKYPAFHRQIKLRDRKGGDMSEWPEDLRVREYPK